MYLLDTKAISETSKPLPNAGYLAWISQAQLAMSYISVLTIGELTAGVERLPSSARRSRLEGWIDQAVLKTFHGRILPIDVDVAETWGRIRARAGRTIPTLDGLLAATAIARGLTVVTRNTRDFAATGAVIFDPWT